MRVTPKISDRPADTRNSEEASVSPFRSWMRSEGKVTEQSRQFRRPRRSAKREAERPCLLQARALHCASLRSGRQRLLLRRPHLLHLGIARQRVLAVDEAPVGHDTLAVLETDPADEGAERRLMIEGAIGDRT